MFVVMERKNSTKKVSYGHFAECNTRQSWKPKPFSASFPALPSAEALALKEFPKKIKALPSTEQWDTRQRISKKI
jgi:hypothetical protein